ncbi:neutral/alkaline non-lysosomal ceramidase N-terminal domain-containing protein [Candidatus Latescibacterota bacterium]
MTVPLNQTGKLHAGAARINITPTEPVPLAGFYARQTLFDGVHDDIYARAAVFESGGIAAVLVAVDTCVLPDCFCDDVIARISRECSIPTSSIILNASHTHSGPALYVPRGSKTLNAFWLDDHPWEVPLKRYTEWLKECIVSVVGEAQQNLAPARIGFGKGESSIGINRRESDNDGHIRIGENPDGIVDRELSVVRIDSYDGETVAVLFNLGVHGTCMMTDQITGDWCGLAAWRIERGMSNDTVALYLSGTAGDVNPVGSVRKTFGSPGGDADTAAVLVAEKTMAVAGTIITHDSGEVRAEHRIVSVPGKPYRGLIGYDPAYEPLMNELSPVQDTQVRTSMIAVGDIVFVGCSGEMFSEIGRDIKSGSPYPITIVMGLCNGYSSYILPGHEADRGGYEYNASVIAGDGGETVVENMIDLINTDN